MTLELRVLTGSRAGDTVTFDGGEVTIGRHASSSLRFDPQADLDVSTRHAELRQFNGAWNLVDEASTNGTYVNGVRVTGSKALRDGDVISFGLNGPRVEVVSGAGIRSGSTPKSSTRVSPHRMDTGVRVALAVKEQTSAMRRMFAIAVVVLVLIGGAGFVWTQRQSSVREAQLNALILHGDSVTNALQNTIKTLQPGDSTSRAAMLQEIHRQQQELDSAKQMIVEGRPSKSGVEALSKSMSPAGLDVPKIREANDAAVAFIVADLDGVNMGGSGFSISPNGLVVTNKHVVRTAAGQPAKRVAVKFANTNGWKHAHVVRVSDTDDLALLQIEDSGRWPVVSGVSKAGGHGNVGASVVTIGYPLSNDTPMEGEGMNFTARTTTTLGTVSKLLDDVLQLDSFSAHGASGSPVFDADGFVVGVIYGGATESGGRIVYAVPAQRLSAFLGADAAGVLR